MIRKICAVAIGLNTIMFMFSVVMGLHKLALLNFLSGALCWVHILLNPKENKNE